jgi:hypothetical protein
MEVQQIAPGLWRWTGLHPDWTPEQGGPEGWEQAVGCVYFEAPEAIVLIDPLVPPEDTDRFLAALDRDVDQARKPVVVLVTVAWHLRSAEEVAERYGGMFAPAELPAGVAGHRVPGPGGEPETIYWLPDRATLVPGDLLLVAPGGDVRLCPASWLPEGTITEVVASLHPLLDWPVERVLVSHGEPVLERGREALERALQEAPSAA